MQKKMVTDYGLIFSFWREPFSKNSTLPNVFSRGRKDDRGLHHSFHRDFWLGSPFGAGLLEHEGRDVPLR